MNLRVERWVTAGLAALLAGVLLWRGGAFEPEALAERVADRPVRLAAVWLGESRREERLYLLAERDLRAALAHGRFFETVAGLPGTPFATRPAAVFRVADETPVPREAPERALAGGNRCLLALDPGVVASLGGPLTAVVTLRQELDLADC